MTEAPTQEQPSKEKVTLLISGILAGTIIVPSPLAAIALALLLLIPKFISDALASLLADGIARLAVVPLPESRDGSGANQGALEEDAAYRALYAINALNRLVEAAEGDEEGRQERIDKALEREKHYFELHLAAEERRGIARQAKDAMVALYGKILAWHHGPRTLTDRPHHVEADNKNVDVSKGVPHLTGAWPGVLPECKCYFGPKIEGARFIH